MSWMSRCEVYHEGKYLLLNQKLNHSAFIKSQNRKPEKVQSISQNKAQSLGYSHSSWESTCCCFSMYQLLNGLTSLIPWPNNLRCLQELLGFPLFGYPKITQLLEGWLLISLMTESFIICRQCPYRRWGKSWHEIDDNSCFMKCWCLWWMIQEVLVCLAVVCCPFQPLHAVFPLGTNRFF